LIRTTLKIDETISAYVTELELASSDLLNQALSKGGAVFNEVARQKLRAQEQTGFSLQPSKLHKTIIRGEGISKNFGDRLRKDGSQDKPESMANLIKNYLDEKNHLVVVMGRHPTFKPIKFRDGKRVGFQGKTIKGTSKGGENNPNDIINIFQKLNDGGTKPLSTKQQWLLSSMKVIERNKDGELTVSQPFLRKLKGGKVVPMITKVKYRRTNFATSAYVVGASQAGAIVKSEYERYFAKVMKDIGVAA